MTLDGTNKPETLKGRRGKHDGVHRDSFNKRFNNPGYVEAVATNTLNDIHIPHKGNIVGNVIEGAFTVLDNFEAATEQMDGMKALSLNKGEQAAFANAALTLKYDHLEQPAPVTEDALLQARRFDDRASDLWTTFSRVQENMIKGDYKAGVAPDAISALAP